MGFPPASLYHDLACIDHHLGMAYGAAIVSCSIGSRDDSVRWRFQHGATSLQSRRQSRASSLIFQREPSRVSNVLLAAADHIGGNGRLDSGISSRLRLGNRLVLA